MAKSENNAKISRMNNIGILPWDLDFFCGFKSNLMKSNIVRNNKRTEIVFYLQVVDINEYSIELENGYLSVTAFLKIDNNKNSEKIFNEYGEEQYEFTQCIYVGNIEKKYIRTKLEDGILKVTLKNVDAFYNVCK